MVLVHMEGLPKEDHLKVNAGMIKNMAYWPSVLTTLLTAGISITSTYPLLRPIVKITLSSGVPLSLVLVWKINMLAIFYLSLMPSSLLVPGISRHLQFMPISCIWNLVPSTISLNIVMNLSVVSLIRSPTWNSSLKITKSIYQLSFGLRVWTLLITVKTPHVILIFVVVAIDSKNGLLVLLYWTSSIKLGSIICSELVWVIWSMVVTMVLPLLKSNKQPSVDSLLIEFSSFLL